MREIIVSDLIKEVIGPSLGVREVIGESPLNEYISGVLAPVTSTPSQHILTIDDDAELPSDQFNGAEEDETEDIDLTSTPFFAPALDPKNKPPSMGLSFYVETNTDPCFQVCITWARYSQNDDGDWVRSPRFGILNLHPASNQTLFLNNLGQSVSADQAEISIHIIVRNPSDNHFFITFYFVNRISCPQDQPITPEYYIFQPQIRVKCEDNTKIIPNLRKKSTNPEECLLDFLYRDQIVLGRGHLCSAVWKDIDPECISENAQNLDFPEVQDDIPFTWIDGEILEPEVRARFSPADIRTEFVPIYPIPSPDFGWIENNSVENPELLAEELANCYDRVILKTKLTPLGKGYSNWIDALETQLPSFSQNELPIAQNIITNCRNLCNRIYSGIEILYSNDEARLSFCFAQHAMETQYNWSKKSPGLRYHPFQLAFLLINLESIVNPDSSDREKCDLLWIPTGGGKTEAYLGIIAFTIAYRRRMCLLSTGEGDHTGAGVSVITRYTLRLLTIQQFRRALILITACEYLRVENLITTNPIGWRPENCGNQASNLWGSTQFSIGLWVGGGVTPNRMGDIIRRGMRPLPGALSILTTPTNNPHFERAEPAQVLNCPACDSILAIPETGLQPGNYRINFAIRNNSQNDLHLTPEILQTLVPQQILVSGCILTRNGNSQIFTITVDFSVERTLDSRIFESIWNNIREHFQTTGVIANLLAARASRPGYFIRSYNSGRNTQKSYDFEIFCANPVCPLHHPWIGGAPNGWFNSVIAQHSSIANRVNTLRTGSMGYDDDNHLIHALEPFRNNGISPFISNTIPIPALTVDDQIYRRLPTILISTVDKFARPPFEPKTSGLFGNVTHHHSIFGYYRPFTGSANDHGHPIPAGTAALPLFRGIHPLNPPDLIIQDELHLLEGPLGSLMGMYETAVDFLSETAHHQKIKYIASTATIRRAEDQVKSLFVRDVQLFPPHGFSVNDKFFVRNRQPDYFNDTEPGRLYVGICAPGRGPLTPIVRIWSRLLQTAFELRDHPNVDPYWTLAGYFNAIRELGGVRALYRQDIPQRMMEAYGNNPRPVLEDYALELSGRKSSTELPGILESLNKSYPDAYDTLFTTSMFGTGVDVSRLGLMVVHGQPKSTSSYIQATGRVGRSRGGLIITFYRSTRPRDLNHYENFCGYHKQIHRFVEPVTVFPFSPGVIDRAGGAVGVFILRNMRNPTIPWNRLDSASEMRNYRTTAPEVLELTNLIHSRSQNQPILRRIPSSIAENHVNAELDRWHLISSHNPSNLAYVEYAIESPPTSPVVLGDYQHIHAGFDVVYENVPQSLRDIEETTGFQTR